MFITSKNKYLSNDMKIFGTCSIPLSVGSEEMHEAICKLDCNKSRGVDQISSQIYAEHLHASKNCATIFHVYIINELFIHDFCLII